jgi:signal transduction histidine kinase
VPKDRSTASTISRPGPISPRPSQAEQAHRDEMLALLGRFTSAVAHDLRNPLAAIGAGVQFLAKGVTRGPEREETFEMILAEVRRLDRLLGDFCDAGRPPRLNVGAHDARRVASRAAAAAADVLKERDVHIALDVETGLPQLTVDRDRLQRLIVHLLWNAAEASAPGSEVLLRVRDASLVPSSDLLTESAAYSVLIEVIDNGEGIAPEHQPRIFEPFFSTKTGHRGLGLPVCQMIAEAHRGDLRVGSEPGEGTAVTLLLPNLTSSEGAA